MRLAAAHAASYGLAMAVDRFAQAEALTLNARKQLEQCAKVYGQSLAKQAVETELLIDIKQVIDSLRSALDYCARELFDKFGAAKGDPNIDFPSRNEGRQRPISQPSSTRNPGPRRQSPGPRDAARFLPGVLDRFQQLAPRSRHAVEREQARATDAAVAKGDQDAEHRVAGCRHSHRSRCLDPVGAGASI